MNEWNAVVLGGGDPGEALATAHGVAVKPLIELAGRPMGQYVLEALRASGRVNRVAYVGPLTPSMRALVDLEVPDAGRLIANLEAGLLALGGQRRVLVATADVPLVTGAMLADVLSAAPEAGLVYPIVRREVCEAAFPGVKRTYVKLKEGSFTGGNVFLLDPALALRFLPKIEQLLAQRKRPLALARLIGFGVLARLLTGRLGLPELERRVSAILNAPVRALITGHAAIGTDVDKRADLDLVRAHLKQASSS